MRCRRYLLVAAMIALPAESIFAGVIFNRHAKTNPAQRLQEVISTLQTDPSETKREAAAEELRQFDASTNAEIVPVLIQALQNDPKAGVRLEAAQSLGKIRPVSQQAGTALEQALAQDNSMRVRWQARTALWQYHLAGYRGRKVDPPVGAGTTTQEPPLADPIEAKATGGPSSSSGPAVRSVPRPAPAARIDQARNATTTGPVKPVSPAGSTWRTTTPPSAPADSKTLPPESPEPPLVPADPPPLKSPPPATDEGPELPPPQ